MWNVLFKRPLWLFSNFNIIMEAMAHLQMIYWLAVSTPPKNMSSSIGMMTFPIYGKRIQMFQTTKQEKISYIQIPIAMKYPWHYDLWWHIYRWFLMINPYPYWFSTAGASGHSSSLPGPSTPGTRGTRSSSRSLDCYAPEIRWIWSLCPWCHKYT